MPENAEKIRQRKSYQRYMHLLHELEQNDALHALKLIHKVLDEHYCFGSQKKSDYAYESLQQVIKDRDEGVI